MHLGLAGFMGVNVADADDPSDCGTGGGDGFGGLGGYSPAVNSGALVCDVYPGAPAATAGLAGGDVITSVNGTTVSTADGLTSLMSDSKPGSQLTHRLRGRERRQAHHHRHPDRVGQVGLSRPARCGGGARPR